jgi:hypothetical protein
MTMRATHRKRMSRAVESTEVGWNARSSGVSRGQPSVANGHSPLENHVSRTSGSCSQPVALGRPSSRRTSPRPRYQTGIWWPHHSWREMHHGRISSSHAM